MCGILGRAATRPISDDGAVSGGVDAMAHRGPDDRGEWWSADRRVGFGHRRLAIIDLSPGGHQPMVDGTGDYTIVYNGEIYNYQDVRALLASRGHAFRTASDTEVILAGYREWGPEVLTHLNGMFALAIFDRKRETIMLARDRAGEKPLYYRVDGTSLWFGSELKALMADRHFDRVIDREALDCFLAMGYVPGTRCILRGVQKLPPAHALTFSLRDGLWKSWRYWTLPPRLGNGSAPANEEQLLDELEALLADAVRRQLVADVPIGVLLSGGVDSSLITAFAIRAAPRVKTFTIRFPGFGEYDETEHARLVARHFGTDHLELVGEPASADLLPSLARQFDEPVADSSMVPTYLVTRLIRQHCTVALGGDGGDELFGGYSYYNRLLRLRQLAAPVPAAVRRGVARLTESVFPVGFRGRNWLQGLAADFDHALPVSDGLFDAAARRRLMAAHEWSLPADSIRANRVPRVPDLLDRATRMDFENYLAEDILVKVDRASMLNSIEVRAPFLDYRVIEFAFAKLGSAQKATPRHRKVFLKKLCDRLLPREFDQERKQGLSIPLTQWAASGPWAGVFEDTLLSADSLFDRQAVQDLLRGQRAGRNNGERLFALTLFELWRREYRVTF